MPKLVVHGATLRCNQGTSPSSLSVLPTARTDGDQKPAATVMDFLPSVNIAPFGMCTTQANPQVASATAAAQGVLTPVPCMPVVTGPWSPGSAIVTIQEKKALTADSTCNCAWTGVIEVADPGTQMLEDG
jgi:hypothetical protein